MRASREFRAIVTAAVTPLDTPANRERYAAGDYPRAHLTRDVSKRYRWDLYWHAYDTTGPFYTVGLNDAHIDTVLRSIVPPLPTTPTTTPEETQ